MGTTAADVTWARVGVIFAGGFLGTAARVGLLGLFGDHTVGLAVVNLVGCLALGLVSGVYRGRVTLLRLFLAVGGIASFTSWSSLALQTLHAPWIAVAETLAGIALAGLGHVLGLRLSDGGAAR